MNYILNPMYLFYSNSIRDNLITTILRSQLIFPIENDPKQYEIISKHDSCFIQFSNSLILLSKIKLLISKLNIESQFS